MKANFLERMERLPYRRFTNLLSRFFYFLLWAFASAAFYTVLDSSFKQRDFIPLAAAVVPVIATLFGFTSLLYSRAQTLPKGRERQRSLYAAERGMQATALFFIGTAISSFGAYLASASIAEISPAIFSIFYLGMFLELMAFGCFFFALRTMAHRFLRELPMRELARSLRDRD